ncbi:NAD(P)-dependent alcohol dehydrogenase [Kaistia granuli]|uniref:NAD(P)-dependent alcohol dehydrogenase n=1 Tax=Kaistia granuli TaxID=363259 RepID=UPI000372DF3B|nr:NAD(P)-dependent alcohol dehydrogenase [Kaistia granuli]
MSYRIRAALVKKKSGPFVVEMVDLAEPRDDEVLVKILATGVCHTDIGVRNQSYPVPLPAVLGHEGAGIVEKVGRNVTKVVPGDHVIVTYDFCGRCENCQQGQPGFCVEFYARNLSGARVDGTSPIIADGHVISGCFFCQSSFADKAIASERNVVKIRKDVPIEIMGPLGCGIQTGAGAVINSLAPRAGSSIAIFGAGAVGLSAVMAAKIVGCTTIIAIDLNEGRLQLARELGATHVVNGAKVDAVKEIQAITDGGAQYSLECTSVPRVFRQAVDCLRIPGTCGLIGAAALGVEVNLEMSKILFGRTIKGIMQGDCVADVFVPKLIEFWRAGLFPFDRLTKLYDLSEINEAVHAAESGEVVKPIVTTSRAAA